VGSHHDTLASFRAAYYQLENKPVNLAPARRDFYKIWLILDKGWLSLETGRIQIRQPALVFLHPLARYSFEPLTAKRSGYWCIFTAGFAAAAPRPLIDQQSSLFPPTGQIFFPEKQAVGVIRFYFEQIVQEFNGKYALGGRSLLNLVELLMHEGSKLAPLTSSVQQGQNAATRLTSRFLSLLEKQYPITSPDESLKLKKPSDFARKLAVHVNHLNAAVQQVSGKSTRQLIAARMLNESKALLYYSDWPVADIAYSLGFEYPNHFATFFRKHTGQTPLAYRK